MVCKPHFKGTRFGELQLALWKKQFGALREGDHPEATVGPDVQGSGQLAGRTPSST
jgi:hypothetical protein